MSTIKPVTTEPEDLERDDRARGLPRHLTEEFRPPPERGLQTTVAGIIALVVGAGFFVWGFTWLMLGLDRSATPLIVGGVTTMVLAAWTAVIGGALLARLRWAWPAANATFVLHALAVIVFGFLSAMASGAGPVAYLGSAVLLALMVAVPVLLTRDRAKMDFAAGGAGTAVATTVLVAIVALWTLPTVGLLVSSFRAEDAVTETGWWTVFTNPQLTLQNYDDVLFSSGAGGLTMWDAFLNTLAIVLPATVIPISIALFAAYAFAWMEFPGRRVLFVLVVSLMAVPLQMSLIPLLQLYVGGARIDWFGFELPLFPDLNLNGEPLSVWIAHTGFGLPLAIFLLYNYVSGLPKDIFEAARIDGADHYAIFWRLVVPLSIPALAAFGIFQFLWTWNDYLIALTFIGAGSDNAPLTMALANLAGSRGEAWHLLTAGAFVVMSVPLVVFFTLQRYFVRGLLAGSVKG